MSTHKLSAPAVGALRAAIIIVAVILIYILICSSTGIFYNRFMKNAEKIARIPGLGDGFIPQGFCYSDALGAWLSCGYFDDAPSRIYVIGTDGKLIKSLALRRENGDDYTGHAGGISASGEHVWISNYFWIGEYHSGEKYKTRDENHKTTPDGSEYGALIYGYARDDSMPYGTDPEKPVIALSVRDIVQGFCVTASGKYVLSTSAGLASSHLYIYDCTGVTPTDSVSYGGRDIPLYYLDSNTLTDTVTLPHMSEDLDYHDGKVCIAFEAGARKYGSGLLPFSLRYFMGYTLD